MSSQFQIKQGDTLALNGQAVQDDGTPIDLTSATITSQIRDTHGNLVNNGVGAFASSQPTQGLFSLTWQSDSTWPIGGLRCDVLFVNGAVRVHSDTMLIKVAPAVTQ